MVFGIVDVLVVMVFAAYLWSILDLWAVLSLAPDHPCKIRNGLLLVAWTIIWTSYGLATHTSSSPTTAGLSGGTDSNLNVLWLR